MWKRRRATRDFADEVESHIAIETDRLIATGMSERDARHAARRTFGNVASRVEQYHASRPSAAIESVWRNTRHALRGIGRRPVFAATAILTLAFGVGVNSALFTLFYSLVLRPPPVGEPSRHVNVSRQVGDDGRGYMLNVKGRASMLSWPDYVRLRNEGSTLEELAVYRRHTLRLDAGNQSSSFDGELVSCNYFAAARIGMHLGRPFGPDECRVRGTGSVAVLSHSYWTNRFGGDSAIVGRSITVNAQPVTVIGIARRQFSGLAVDAADAWIPITMLPALQPALARDFDADISWLAAFGRIREGVRPAQAAAELTTIARREDGHWPGRVSRINVATGSAFLDSDSRANVLIATGGAAAFGALILLMCCANVMNLLLARAAARQREIGIRLALGASRRTLLSHLMIESGVLALIGGACALLLAWLLPPLIRFSAPDQELNIVLTPDMTVLLVTMLIALGSTFLFGLFPALQATGAQLSGAIRGEPGSARGSRTARWRGAAVVTQVSVSALLLVIAAMFLRATQRSFNVEPGFAVEGVTAVQMDFGPAGDDTARTRQFLATLQRELGTVPAVRSVALGLLTPLRGRASTVVLVNGAGEDADQVSTALNEVSGSYFETLGVPFVSGRTFIDDDNLARTPAVVSRAFANLAWPEREAVGQVIRQDTRELMVVGVVADVQSVSLGIDDGPYLYTPVSRAIVPGTPQVLVRADVGASTLQAPIAQVARQLDPNVVVTARGLEQELQRVIAPVMLTGQVTSALGLTALLLAMIGVYGVIAFTVSQRSREIGIRMALGATESRVRAMVFRQGARVVGVGLLIGVLAAIGVAQAIRSVLFGLSAVDAVALSSVVLVLGGVAAIAIAIPAVRASRVDPMTCLRAE